MYNVSATIYKPGSSSAATDITMYTVSAVESGDATMHEVTSETEKGMKANNGYFLQGAASTTYRTTAIAGSVTAPETNLIKAVTAEATVKSEGNYVRYALLTYDANNYGLYKLNSTGVTMPAGKAYLEIDNSSAARVFDFLNFDFGDGETTSISEELRMKSEESAAAPVYNLNGQRVAQPQKGLYIVNGKKVIIK